MAIAKDVLKVLIFSIVQTGILPIFLLPYGAFIIPYALIFSFYLFFIPIFLVSVVMKFGWRSVDPDKKYKLFGAGTALVCLGIACLTIATQRGTGEYFGNNLPTYLQLGVATIFGFLSWNFLSGILLSDLFLS